MFSNNSSNSFTAGLNTATSTVEHSKLGKCKAICMSIVYVIHRYYCRRKDKWTILFVAPWILPISFQCACVFLSETKISQFKSLKKELQIELAQLIVIQYIEFDDPLAHVIRSAHKFYFVLDTFDFFSLNFVDYRWYFHRFFPAIMMGRRSMWPSDRDRNHALMFYCWFVRDHEFQNQNLRQTTIEWPHKNAAIIIIVMWMEWILDKCAAIVCWAAFTELSKSKWIGWMWMEIVRIGTLTTGPNIARITLVDYINISNVIISASVC